MVENAPAMPQPTPGPLSRHGRGERVHITGPLILIVVGLVFLGQNTGMLPGDVWLSLWQFWPVVLILVGLELVLGHSGIGSTIASLIMVAMVLAVVGMLAFVGQAGGWTIGGNHSGISALLTPHQVTQEIGNAQRGIIDLEHGAGKLELSALPVESSQLLDADLSYAQSSAIERRAEARGDGTYVRLGTRNNWNGFPGGTTFRQDWTVKLSPNVPLDISVHSGASAVAMDLSGLRVTSLNVDTGASSLDVTLPEAAGKTDARVKAGLAGVHIRVPEGVAARISVKNGLSGAAIDEGRFPKNGSYYQSQNYDTASNRVDLYVETGISGVTID